MTTSRTIAIATLAVTGAVLSVGCGRDGGKDTTTPTRATGGDFVARANGICTAANDDFVALGDTREYENLADFRVRFGTAIAIAQRQYAAIAALEPPADIANDVRAYIAEGSKSVALSRELYDQVLAGTAIADAEAATLGTSGGQANVEGRRKAALAAGLEACAS